MKFQMRWLLIFLILAMFLTSCSKTDPDPVIDPDPIIKPEPKPDPEPEPEPDPEPEPEPEPEPDEVGIVDWTDENKLVRLFKEDDQFYLTYYLDVWEDFYNITELTEEEYEDFKFANRDLKIDELQGNILDIKVVSIDGYGGSFFMRNELPIMVLLMEEGPPLLITLYPPMDFGTDYIQEVQYIDTELNLLQNIKELTVDEIGEGIGGLTIYATAEDGLKYDVRHAIDYNLMQNGVFVSVSQDEASEQYEYILLDFEPSGWVTMTIDHGQYNHTVYSGTYDFHLDESSSKGVRAPAITFNLSLDYNDWYDYPESYIATYMLSESYGEYLFFLVEGDSFNWDDTAFYEFYVGDYPHSQDIWYLSDEAFIYYFLETNPEIKNMVEQYDMAVIVDGSITDLGDYGYARNIRVGSQDDEHFVTTMHYALNNYGHLFYYDVVTDYWYLEY